jgi:hypothetical protein
MSFGKLLLSRPDGPGSEYLISKSPVTIGRAPDNDLVIDHLTISRHHARLQIETGALVLTDLGSANGTFAGETRLSPNTPLLLLPGQPVRCGDINLVYQPPTDLGSLQTVQPARKPQTEPPAPTPTAAPTEGTQPTDKSMLTLEYSKLILPLVVTLLTACLSGLFLLLTTEAGPLARIFNPTPAPTATPAPQLIFQDDFSNPGSGWEAYKDADGSIDYKNGQFVFDITKGIDFIYVGNAHRTFGDIQFEADANLEKGSDATTYGLVCRMFDDNNFYLMRISGGGEYAILKYEGDQNTTLISGRAENQAAIKRGVGAKNHLRAECIGSTLTFYANDTQLATISDSTFATGDIAFMAGATDNTRVSFDNFKAYKP